MDLTGSRIVISIISAFIVALASGLLTLREHSTKLANINSGLNKVEDKVDNLQISHYNFAREFATQIGRNEEWRHAATEKLSTCSKRVDKLDKRISHGD